MINSNPECLKSCFSIRFFETTIFFLLVRIKNEFSGIIFRSVFFGLNWMGIFVQFSSVRQRERARLTIHDVHTAQQRSRHILLGKNDQIVIHHRFDQIFLLDNLIGRQHFRPRDDPQFPPVRRVETSSFMVLQSLDNEARPRLHNAQCQTVVGHFLKLLILNARDGGPGDRRTRQVWNGRQFLLERFPGWWGMFRAGFVFQTTQNFSRVCCPVQVRRNV